MTGGSPSTNPSTAEVVVGAGCDIVLAGAVVVVVTAAVVGVVDSPTESMAWVVDEAAVGEGSAHPATSRANANKPSLMDRGLTRAVSKHTPMT
jgi:hypothetical protein